MVYLMQGFIGSGKTTKAIEIEAETNGIRITPDEWMRNIFGYDPLFKIFSEALNSILDLLKPIWTKSAQNGIDVILDYGFWTIQSRIEIEKYLKEQDIEFKWIILTTSIDECRRRNTERMTSGKDLLKITPETFETLLKQYEQ